MVGRGILSTFLDIFDCHVASSSGKERVATAVVPRMGIERFWATYYAGKDSCRELSAVPRKNALLHKPTQWIDRTDQNGVRHREVTERVPALECKRNPKHWFEVDPAEVGES